ncbi:endo-1,4-beta-xylanase [Aquipuribacter nitratireducens]|uniref:Beta-xylanase n=1 Tax=Aquipuribacter nitratireducens TaxID=650104 RepID=A0ABW0GP32_9MICO
MRTWGAALLVLVVAGGLAGPATGAGTTSAGDEPVVVSTDFEDGTTGPWVQNGDATLSVVDDGEGGNALLVAGRVNDYDGIKSPPGLLEPGASYTFSMRVRLAPGTAGSAGVRLVVEPAYTWVGNSTMTADAWTTVSGTYTVPADGDSATQRVYIGTGALAGPYDYLVDDVVITGGPTGPDVETVTSLDFDADSFEPWTQSGSPTLTFVDAAGADGSAGRALSITRTADFDGIQSPLGLLEADREYAFSLRARLPEGASGSAGVRLVLKPAYTWVASGTVDATGWTTITGTYTLPADVDPAETQLYVGTEDTGSTYTVLVDDVVVTAAAEDSGDPDGPVGPGLQTSFEDGLDGWVPRGDGDGDPTLAVTTDYAATGTRSALVSGRSSQGDGIGRDVTGLMTTGTTYEITAQVRFAPGATADDVWLSMQRTGGGATSFDTVGQFAGVTSAGWTRVSATYQVPTADSLFVYFETAYPDGSAGSFLVDDVAITPLEAPEIQDVTPIQDTVPWPVGVAIDQRETTGPAAELLTRHFDQVSAENHMKPEAWYSGSGPETFRLHPQAEAIMDFAVQEDLRVYGHVLVWHSQTPAWFFQAADGSPLTTSEADKQVLRERMRTHVFSVAETLADDYGPFGSEGNPLVAWDVVNEVISDSGEFSDGMRRSEWYRVLGEEFVDLAFVYADEAFNDVYAAEGVDRPVTLFINDYNTELSGKQARYRALVERLLAREVPIDGVGHQFHVSLSLPVQALEDAILAFDDLPLTQVVTELDVTTGTPVTEALLVDQGYYYRDAFRIFREQADELYAVTIWGLTDGRSWRAANGDPLLFDDGLQAKPAYYGVVDGELSARQRSAFVFAGDVPLDGEAVGSPVWDRLPLLPVEDVAAFQLRWEPDHLTAYVTVADTTASAQDEVTFVVGDSSYVVARDGSTDASGVRAVAAEVDGGYVLVVHLPLSGAAEGDLVSFDAVVTDDGTDTAWNEPGALGTLTLVEPLSFTQAVEAVPVAPTVDGDVDDVWSDAQVVTTDTQVSGTGGATAAVRTLWQGQTLYVLAEVSDDEVDTTGSDPWQQDSVEIFLDAGNVKNGPYRYDDTQVRVSAENVVSFGTGDEGFQADRLESATTVVDGGYVVEAAVSLLEYGGLGTFHGFDVQVNDAADGARTGIRTWADPTGAGYQTTARWGVLELVGPAFVPDPAVEVGSWLVAAGGTLDLSVSGFVPGSEVEVVLRDERGGAPSEVVVATVTAGPDGSATVAAVVPQDVRKGPHTLLVRSGDLVAGLDRDVVVRGGPAGRGPR